MVIIVVVVAATVVVGVLVVEAVVVAVVVVVVVVIVVGRVVTVAAAVTVVAVIVVVVVVVMSWTVEYPLRYPNSTLLNGATTSFMWRCASLSKRNFKFLQAKKIPTLNGGFLCVRNTKDKIKIFW